MADKVFINAQDLLDDSFRLARKIYEDGFRPNYIIGIWRGGTPVGIAVQEALDHLDVKTDHIAIRTSSYDGIEDQRKDVRVHGLNYIVDNVNAEDRLLIIDDVFDTGRSIQAVIDKIRKESRRNTPETIRIATVYYKPSKRKVLCEPDYYIHQTEDWLVFPHELQGLTEEEIIKHKPVASLARVNMDKAAKQA
jgi:hypoxanthine phosphoribosyltransferase